MRIEKTIIRESDGRMFTVIKYGEKSEILSHYPWYTTSARENNGLVFPDEIPPFSCIWDAVKYAKYNLARLV